MIVEIKAKIGAKINKLTKVSENSFEVKVKNRPIENKANDEIIKLLGKY